MNKAKIAAIIIIASMLAGCGKSNSGNDLYTAPDGSSVSSVENEASNAELDTAAATTETATAANAEIAQKAAEDNDSFTVNITGVKRYDTYSCSNGEYFFTFESERPQFEYSNPKYSSQQSKLNEYFIQVQNAMDVSQSTDNCQLIDRSTVEAILNTDSTKNTFATQEYSVEKTADKYCSISISNYNYAGGAHGYGWTSGYVIDLVNGNILSMSDLFTSVDEFKRYLGNYIYYEYYTQYSQLQNWNIDELTNAIMTDGGSNWYIKDDALYIEYSAYTLDCYAAGSQLVSVPLDICSFYWSDLANNLFSNITPKGKAEFGNTLNETTHIDNNNNIADNTPVETEPASKITIEVTGTAEKLFTGFVNTENDPLNIRSAPSTDAAIIGTFPKGAAVDIYSEENGWCEVRYNGQVGYVSKEFIKCETGGYAKPVIYLYPEEKTDVSVKVKFKNGGFTCTYPDYNNGWNVTAYPDGKIINQADNDEYSYLYWEGEGMMDYDFSEGFVVKRENTAKFLKGKLSYMGLTPKEYNEFIVYWLPIMQQNEYNLVSFQTDNYDESAKLDITPEPDSVLRVFMAFRKADANTSVTTQKLDKFDRKGFSVIEWGGTEVK